jgi:hypothetical protein
MDESVNEGFRDLLKKEHDISHSQAITLMLHLQSSEPDTISYPIQSTGMSVSLNLEDDKNSYLVKYADSIKHDLQDQMSFPRKTTSVAVELKETNVYTSITYPLPTLQNFLCSLLNEYLTNRYIHLFQTVKVRAFQSPSIDNPVKVNMVSDSQNIETFKLELTSTFNTTLCMIIKKFQTEHQYEPLFQNLSRYSLEIDLVENQAILSVITQNEYPLPQISNPFSNS